MAPDERQEKVSGTIFAQLHPGSRQAHEAARCANEQGKFWASHDALFATAPKTSPEQRKASAQEVGLDLPAFVPCRGNIGVRLRLLSIFCRIQLRAPLGVYGYWSGVGQ